MGGTAQYFHWGFILISVANLIVIGLMVVVFVLAAVLRRPGEPRMSTLDSAVDADATDAEAQP